MLGTGDISITNLFYASAQSSSIYRPNLTISNRYYYYSSGRNDSPTFDTDEAFTLIEIDVFGNALRQYTPSTGVGVADRETTGFYNPKDNCYWVLVKLKSDHPHNTTGDDNDYWIMKVDIANFQEEYVMSLHGIINLRWDRDHVGMPDFTIVNRFYIYDVIGDVVYIAGNRDNGLNGGFTTIDTSANTATVHLYGTNQGGNYLIGKNGGDYYFIYRENVSLPFDNPKLVKFNFTTNQRVETEIGVYSDLNPAWKVVGSTVFEGFYTMGDVKILNGLLYISVSQLRSILITTGVSVEPRRVEILVYNIDTLTLVNTLIGATVPENAGSAYGVSVIMTDDFKCYLSNSAQSSLSFYAPEITKANTLLKDGGGNLLKSPE